MWSSLLFLSCLVQAVPPQASSPTPTLSSISVSSSSPQFPSSISKMTNLPILISTLSIDEPLYHNLTLIEMTPRSISLRWTCNHLLHDKYELTLKPLKSTYRVVETVPRNSCYQTIENLLPDTDYQIFVTLFTRQGRKRSNVLTLKTPMEEPEAEFDEVITEERSRELKMPEIKLVELMLVGLALILWIVAIALFFHRWGKIRMLLPYQPAYKEKQAGTCSNCVLNPHHPCPRHRTTEFHGVGSGGLGLVSLADATCSPMRPRHHSFVLPTGTEEGIVKIPMEHRVYRKAKSVEYLITPESMNNPLANEIINQVLRINPLYRSGLIQFIPNKTKSAK